MSAQAWMRGFAGALLAVDLQQLFGDLRVADSQFLANSQQRLVDAQSRIDTDDQQIDRVGDAPADLFAAAFDQAGQRDVGRDEGNRREERSSRRGGRTG